MNSIRQVLWVMCLFIYSFIMTDLKSKSNSLNYGTVFDMIKVINQKLKFLRVFKDFKFKIIKMFSKPVRRRGWFLIYQIYNI